jgi:hypothetical protein
MAALMSLVLILYMVNCEEKDIDTPEDTSSFGLIQSKILNRSCAISGCHASENDGFFSQHGLVLSEGKSYDNLVNAECKNERARADSLKRVVPGDIEKSLLMKKLNCTLSNGDYGNTMPFGREPLSASQIEFIETWIKSGAPRDGTICGNTALLDDTTPGCDEAYTNLLPPSPEEGYQIHIDEFEIQPQFEREIFVYKELGNEEPFYLGRIEMKMRRSSHHFLVNAFNEATPGNQLPAVNNLRDIRNADGSLNNATLAQMEYQIPMIASQTQHYEYEFPPGIGLKIPAHYKLDVNLHYVNRNESKIIGESTLNLYKANAAEITHEAKSIFWSHDQISLAPGQKSIVVREFISNEPMRIFMLTSHTHKLGERFEIQINGGERDGELVYASSSWHHPLTKTFDVPLELKAGQGLRMIVTYNNNTNHTVKFGLTSEDEMAIIYGYYY